MSVFSNQTDSPELKNYKLDRIQNAVRLCGHPERGRPSILVAGTNAKGSIVSYLSALFRANGKKVGSYYSPHLVAREERIQINGKWISEEVWADLEAVYSQAFAGLSFFENATLVAWNYFRDQKVDIQVLEVGMGGRLDATNLVDAEVAVIGPIGMDHAEVLGNTLEKISSEKAGIMRAHRPVWIANPVEKSVLNNFIREADEKLALLRISSSPDSESENKVFSSFISNGEHQAANALLAYRAYLEMCEVQDWNPISLDQSIEVMKASRLPGRTQILSQSPLWILDGAHNLSSVQALACWLQREYPDRKFALVFGLMNDKDLDSIAEVIARFASQVHTASFYPEREYSPLKLAQVFEAKGLITKIYGNLRELIDSLQKSKSEVLVCGSFYLVGEVLKEKNL